MRKVFLSLVALSFISLNASAKVPFLKHICFDSNTDIVAPFVIVIETLNAKGKEEIRSFEMVPGQFSCYDYKPSGLIKMRYTFHNPNGSVCSNEISVGTSGTMVINNDFKCDF